MGMGLNYYFLVYSRIGLIESMMNAWMALAVYFLAKSRGRPGHFLLGSLCYLASIFSKQSTLFFLPAFAALAFYLVGQGRKSGLKNYLPVLIGLGLVLGLTAWAVSNPEYRLRTLYNLRHGLSYHGALSPWLMKFNPIFTIQNIFSSFTPNLLWRGFFQLHLSLAVLGLLEGAAILWLLVKKREFNLELVLILCWFLLARLGAVISPHRVVRFYLPEFYPLALLSAAFVGRREGEKWKKVLVGILLALELGFSGFYGYQWLGHRQYRLYDRAQDLARIVKGKDAVMIGEWAGPFSMESRVKFYYVKRGFNESAVQLENFHINYLLQTLDVPDVSVGQYCKWFPEPCQRRIPVAEFKFFNHRIELYELPPQPP